MDYEKMYKEALERARRLNVDNMLSNEAIEEIFPEVAESEDERIRKFLIQHISEWIGCIEHDLKNSSKDIESEKELAMFKAGLAYLEKQKEQKPVSFSCSHENGKPAEWAELRTEFNINEAFEDGKKEVIDHPDKYGLTKQKPVESIEGGVLTHLGNED